MYVTHPAPALPPDDGVGQRLLEGVHILVYDCSGRGGFLVAVAPPLSDVAGHLGKLLLTNSSCKSHRNYRWSNRIETLRTKFEICKYLISLYHVIPPIYLSIADILHTHIVTF